MSPFESTIAGLASRNDCLVGNIRLRGAVFTINFLAVLAPWAIVVANAVRS